jgi:hypothetical protein
MTLGNQNSEKDAHAQLDCAVNAGVTHIDTAEAYPGSPLPHSNLHYIDLMPHFSGRSFSLQDPCKHKSPPLHDVM